MKKTYIRRGNLVLLAGIFLAMFFIGLSQRVLLAQQPRVFKGHTFIVKALAFSPDGKTLASGSCSEEGTVRLWDLQTGKTRLQLTPSRDLPKGPGNSQGSVSVENLQFSSDNKTLMVCVFSLREPLVLYDPKTGDLQKCIQTVEDSYTRTMREMRQGRPFRGGKGMGGGLFSSEGLFCRANMSADGKYVVCLTHYLGDQRFMIWDTAGRQYLTVRSAPKEDLLGVAFVSKIPGSVPLSKPAFITIDHEANIRFWNRKGRKIKNWNVKEHFSRAKDKLVHQTPIRSMAISPDGSILAFGGKEGIVCVFDLEKQKLKLKYVETTKSQVNPITFSADGKKLAWVHVGNGVTVWDIENDKRVDSIGKQAKGTICLALSPNGTTLATAGIRMSRHSSVKESIEEDSIIRVWNLDVKNREESESPRPRR